MRSTFMSQPIAHALDAEAPSTHALRGEARSAKAADAIGGVTPACRSPAR
jgi:hypothetical protein